MLIYADASTTITNQHGMTYKGEALRKETLTFFDLFEKEVTGVMIVGGKVTK